VLAILGEHLARRAVLDHVRPGVHLREGGESGGRERESRGDSNQRALHGRKDYLPARGGPDLGLEPGGFLRGAGAPVLA